MADIMNTVSGYELGEDGTTYFEVVTDYYDDLTIIITKTPIGTADELNNGGANKVEAAANELINALRSTYQGQQGINTALTSAGEIEQITTVDPLTTILGRYQGVLLTDGWKLNGADLVFTVVNNALFYSIGTGAVKAATIFGNVIQLMDFPIAGINTEFFLAENEREYWCLYDENTKITKP